MEKILISSFLLVEGIVLCGIASFLYSRVLKREKTWKKTNGQIIEILEKPGNKGGIIKKPVVRYQTWNGDSVVFENRFGSSNWKIQVGDVVEIMVDPEEPQKAEVIHFVSQKGIPMVLFIAGLVSVVLSGFFYFGKIL